MKLIAITFENGKTIGLTRGEISAIERFARLNGTSPKEVQYHPGHVRYDTVTNLVSKGVMRRGGMGMPYFVEGLLPVQGRSIHSNTPFTLAAVTSQAASR